MLADGKANGFTRLPRTVVDRHRLIERIEQGSRRRVTTVVAPAGYGKSVAIGRWIERSPQRTIAFLDLERDDGDAVRFGQLLAGALVDACGDLDDGAATLVDLRGEELGGDFLDRVVADLEIVGDVVIVLDNFESIRNDGLLADIAALVERAPASTHFVVASRSDPAIGLSRLRLAGELTEVRIDDLRMDADETAELLERAAGVTLTPISLDLLVGRTEGWPAAIQLAALSMRDRDDPATFVATFSGDDREIADYLTDEVLATLGADERRFLVETSVLEHVNGELCDDVTDRSDSQAMLNALERSGMLMVRLDRPGSWYRYHPLLRELLRAELALTNPQRRGELLRRAAAWHAARDQPVEASGYLVDARAWHELLELCRVHGRRCYELGHATTLRDRLLRVPEHVRLASPDAVLTTAILQVMTGHVLAADDELTRLTERGELSLPEQAVVEVLRSAMVSWQMPPERTVQTGPGALALIAEMRSRGEQIDLLGVTAPGSLEVLTLQALGRACHYLGRFDKARAHLGDAMDRSEGVFLWLLHGLGTRALLEATTAHLREAEHLAARLFEFATEHRRLGHPAMAEGNLAVAAISRAQDRLDDAAFALAQALPMIRANHRWNVLGLHSVEAALLAFAEQRYADGVDVVRECSTDGRPPPTPWIQARLAAAESRCHLASGDVVQARRTLAAHRGLRTVEVLEAEIAIAVRSRDLAAARRLLDEERSIAAPDRVELLAWSAVVADAGGRRSTGRDLMVAAVALAEPEDLRRPLLDIGADAWRLLRDQHQVAPTSFLRSILDRQASTPAVPGIVGGGVERLSQRELVMLRYLPTRLTNVEIGERLYISTNTVKTHLKHIYRKLEVTNRSEAIERAEALGLL